MFFWLRTDSLGTIPHTVTTPQSPSGREVEDVFCRVHRRDEHQKEGSHRRNGPSQWQGEGSRADMEWRAATRKTAWQWRAVFEGEPWRQALRARGNLLMYFRLAQIRCTPDRNFTDFMRPTRLSLRLYIQRTSSIGNLISISTRLELKSLFPLPSFGKDLCQKNILFAVCSYHLIQHWWRRKSGLSERRRLDPRKKVQGPPQQTALCMQITAFFEDMNAWLSVSTYPLGVHNPYGAFNSWVRKSLVLWWGAKRRGSEKEVSPGITEHKSLVM